MERKSTPIHFLRVLIIGSYIEYMVKIIIDQSIMISAVMQNLMQSKVMTTEAVENYGPQPAEIEGC